MDEFLYRKLKPGSKFNSLFPNSKCEKVELGQGDTDYSIDKMVEWIKLNQNQTTKVAQLLVKSSLQDTCKSIHDFLYWHFQYKADTEDQLLRSPACAWKQREEGIDCKSYSILASCLLLNLDINHYIRKVAYDTLGEFTHVYVIVPINQETNDLNDGYYMIDGTINTMQEPYCIDEKDEFMSLQHYGLQKPYLADPTESDSNSTWEKVYAVATKAFKLNFGNILKQLSCIGGSGLGDSEYKAAVDKLNNSAFNAALKINKAVEAKDEAAISQAVLEFRQLTLHMNDAYLAKNNSNHWNACTTANLDHLQYLGDIYAFQINPALNIWLDKFFTSTPLPNGYVNMPDFEPKGLLDWVWLNGMPREYDIPNASYKFKDVNAAIPAFEINNYAISPPASGFKPADYLASLQNVINVVKNNGTTPTNNGTTPPNNGSTPIVYNADGSYTQNGIKYDANGKPIQQTAGFGLAIGLFIGVIGLAIVTGGFKNLIPSSSKTATKKPTKSNSTKTVKI